jgi:hypothetical protein
MAEVRLVRFARTALYVGNTVMPAYGNKFSKPTFTQPQLMAVLGLMRFEDWTCREAEVRLAEYAELRGRSGSSVLPDHTTLYRFMRRVANAAMDRVLHAVVSHWPSPRGGRTRQKAMVAVDATGLAPGSISTFFVDRQRDRGTGLEQRRGKKINAKGMYRDPVRSAIAILSKPADCCS